MSDEQIKNIYVPFYRGQPSGYIPGNGIGMTLVKELIKNLNGKVTLQDVEAKIASFIPVYVVWAAFIAFALPFIFQFI